MNSSNQHEDYYDSTRIPVGVKFIVKNGEGLKYKVLTITPIKTCEDRFGDYNNISYLFSYRGINILYTGDIQTMIAHIENDTIAHYFRENFTEQTDVLIMPVEDIIKDIAQTQEYIQLINPK